MNWTYQDSWEISVQFFSYRCSVCLTNNLLLFGSWKRRDRVCDLMVLIRAPPSGFPSPSIHGIYHNKYLETLVDKIACSVQIKMEYKIPSGVDIVVILQNEADFKEGNALKNDTNRCGGFLSFVCLFLSRCWKYCLPHGYSLFYVYVWMENWLRLEWMQVFF